MVDGDPTTFQTPLSGQISAVLAMVPRGFFIAFHSRDWLIKMPLGVESNAGGLGKTPGAIRSDGVASQPDQAGGEAVWRGLAFFCLRKIPGSL
ncbi:hypothetical protein NXC12_PD00448 (plasmid) [Rhizobium etli]|uniref:Uncharacterized protein n=1 Tax=Rhizobium etli TaxID=29449 RepID=A0AAN1BM60_RHIET|nr:hypothetical protein NXC14_PA00466 [Rhizobium sp. NXC14]ARQ13536.1 hypothetical protein NXC12_PD00448 [Rhizobium etli]